MGFSTLKHRVALKGPTKTMGLWLPRASGNPKACASKNKIWIKTVWWIKPYPCPRNEKAIRQKVRILLRLVPEAFKCLILMCVGSPDGIPLKTEEWLIASEWDSEAGCRPHGDPAPKTHNSNNSHVSINVHWTLWWMSTHNKQQTLSPLVAANAIWSA